MTLYVAIFSCLNPLLTAINISYFHFLGSCDISPKSGIVLEDKFKMTCSGWIDQHEPLSYNFHSLRDGVTKTFCNGKFTECSTVLPIGNKSEDYNSMIFVKIADSLGGSYTANITVMVRR